jgi:hypothetical protein
MTLGCPDSVGISVQILSEWLSILGRNSHHVRKAAESLAEALPVLTQQIMLSSFEEV